MMTTYYKILKNGRSFSGGKLTWSLPKDGQPGKWHEVAGDLERCRNGLHLTSEPAYHRRDDVGVACYQAEFEGEAIGPYGGDEIVCRKVRLVRLVPWEELMPEGDGIVPEIPKPPVMSPAYRLLSHVWKHEGDGLGKSWARVNGAMQDALRLAITCGMKFDPEDFARFAKDFNSGYWIGDGEHYYALACGRDGTANPSAYQAYEHWRGRKPFLVHESASRYGYGVANGPAPKIRLCVGARFDWHVKLKTKVKVKVTSFKDDGPKPHVVACSYKPKDEDKYGETKIDKRFTITHDDIAAYHAAIRDAAKAKNEKVGA